MMDEAWIKKHRPNVKVMGMTEERHEAPLTAAEIWIQDFTNTKQKYQPFDRELQVACS